jgi:putative signal transducing protein
MPLRDPVAVYNASTNVEAHLACHALLQSGVEATVVEDHSTAGLWMLGTVPEIHKPQVWVERDDVDRAKSVLEEYEQQAATKREALASGDPVFVTCEECGNRASYPPTQRGTVQECPHCAAYVDVDDTPWAEWETEAGDAELD